MSFKIMYTVETPISFCDNGRDYNLFNKTKKKKEEENIMSYEKTANDNYDFDRSSDVGRCSVSHPIFMNTTYFCFVVL